MKKKKWYYVASKSIGTTNRYNRPVRTSSRLFREITSNHNGDVYCLNCFHSFRTGNKLKRHRRLCNKHDYCYLEMPTKNNQILKNNHGEKSLKAPFIIIADLECILEKEQSCQNNPKNSYTERKAEHKPSGHSWSLICSKRLHWKVLQRCKRACSRNK